MLHPVQLVARPIPIAGYGLTVEPLQELRLRLPAPRAFLSGGANGSHGLATGHHCIGLSLGDLPQHSGKSRFASEAVMVFIAPTQAVALKTTVSPAA